MRKFAIALFALSAAGPTHAGLEDLLKGWLGGEGKEEAGAAALTEHEMIKGVLEALSVGVKRAVDYLGSKGGYLDDPRLRIPVPDPLQRVESLARRLGQGEYADQFIESMNRAAERAVPRAEEIFLDAIGKMTLQDAKAIVGGPDDAATQYFRTHTWDDLEAALLPVVAQATEEVKVTSYYKGFMDRASGLGKLVDTESLNLDKYVTREALDGLFLKLAEEERRIREDPVARTTDILKRVFATGK
ncbi:MAG: DUF4197 domain-containing protein [Gammaproteobacteria bacterium]|nr:DUF4197 domain-containing protein [Gammaproteobacteria bacterium]NIR31091.1 DUF4197 domain-containing protein [Gammaproteobacteria bacterium]NIR98546.1 DUF4197 domain-containing protein [Gammaproteobacteria bacterium]NIT64268.1 DUF4197 domain-containing protein [Gammaproteobacteria bacterium]NIV21873.1 DUF4197 family protein [Gammaproteobacteria bacterium]